MPPEAVTYSKQRTMSITGNIDFRFDAWTDFTLYGDTGENYIRMTAATCSGTNLGWGAEISGTSRKVLLTDVLATTCFKLQSNSGFHSTHGKSGFVYYAY